MTTKMQGRRLFQGIVEHLYGALGDVGSKASELYRDGRHKELVSIPVDPNGFTDWYEFFLAYQSSVLLRKFPGLETRIDTRAIALEKFLESEEKCRDVNHTFRRYTQVGAFRDMLWEAKKEVRRILGRFSWDDTLPFLSHGPGATFGTKRELGQPWYKFGCKQPTLTGDCLAVDTAFLNWCQLWGQIRSENGVERLFVAGSKVTTVPKDARSDRVIAIEPLLNMFYQKGVGGVIRSRLRKHGCDLNDQTHNQRLALSGSISGRLATIDLSSASDSISRELVEFLLPDDWLVAMKCLRSVYTQLPSGEWHFLQKFSSMGNGFTFELESLIFLALTRVATYHTQRRDSPIGVYGDDIVVDTDSVPLLIHLLGICGFSVNVEKSFSSGPFRESCGKHYFLGRDVTPIYLKKWVESPEELLKLLNEIRRLAARFIGIGWGCDTRFYSAWLSTMRLLPVRFRRLSVPEGYGDGGVLRDWDEVTPKPNPVKGWVEGYSTRHVVRQYEKKNLGEYPQLLVSLFNLHRRGGPCSDDMVSEVSMPRYRLREIPLVVTRWHSTGPWVKSF
jgi:hypothetical protein